MTTSRRSGPPPRWSHEPKRRPSPAFFRDVTRTGRLWTVRDAEGYDFTPNEVIARLNATTVPTSPG